MQNIDVKGSILRLRELREKLCSNQKDWTEAYEVRDFVVGHMQELHDMICNRNVRRKKLEDKSSFILEALSAMPNSDSEGDV